MIEIHPANGLTATVEVFGRLWLAMADGETATSAVARESVAPCSAVVVIALVFVENESAVGAALDAQLDRVGPVHGVFDRGTVRNDGPGADKRGSVPMGMTVSTV